MGENVAAIIRENEALRKVAAAAIRVREIGKSCEEHAEARDKLWDSNPEMPKSLTATLMFEQAFATAMQHFDAAVLEAAASGFDWARGNPRLGPSPTGAADEDV